MPEDESILDQARRQTMRLLAQLEAYSVLPTAQMPSGGMTLEELAECRSRVAAAVSASQTLLLDIQAALDTVQGTSSPDSSAGGSSKHGRN